jgi:hypothetical protein
MWTQYDKATHIQHIGECLITFIYKRKIKYPLYTLLLHCPCLSYHLFIVIACALF